MWLYLSHYISEHLVCYLNGSQEILEGNLGLSSVSKGYGVTKGTTISLVLELCVTGQEEKQYYSLPSTVRVHDTVILIMS